MVVFQFLLKQIRNLDKKKKDQNKYLRVSSTKVCSQHFEDNDFKFVYSRTRRLRDGTCLSCFQQEAISKKHLGFFPSQIVIVSKFAWKSFK